MHSDLLSSFLQETQEVIDALRVELAALQHPPQSAASGDAAGLARLTLLAHRLKGSSGLYGYPNLSRLSALLERVLEPRPELQGRARDLLLQFTDTALQVLQEGLDSIRSDEQESDLGVTFNRRGGTALLQELLKLNPQAFRARPAMQLMDMPDDGQEGQQAAASEPADQPSSPPPSLGGELTGFVKANAEVWTYFAPEVQEHLSSLRSQLEQPEGDLDVMFRAAHTIKGSSFMVGLTPLGEFAHRTEDLLGAVRDGLIHLDMPVQSALTDALDLMEGMLRVAEGSGETLDDTHEQLSARLTALASGAALPTPNPGAAEAATPAVPATRQLALENASIRVPARQLEGLMDQMGELVTARARLTQTLQNLEDLQTAMQESQERFQRTVRDFEERHLNPDMVRAVPEGESATRTDSLNLTEQFAELELDTYNDLNILARSITEVSADFAEIRRRLTSSVGDLKEENDGLGKLLRQLRSDLSQTSRVNFLQLTARLKRWAKEHQGHFDFIVEGDDVKVDSAVLQRLMDPLLHLLNNARHHGIDTPEERLKAGKSERGHVWLRAQQTGNFLDITVQDDGRGLNLSAIQERVLAKGLRSLQELRIMDDAELARLILLPGLSTAEQVSTVAGRGVGMDVVATTTRQLGGELLIRTQPGQGTAFTLRLPITRRIMDLLPVQVGDHQLAFAVSSIRALRELSEEELSIGNHGFEVDFEGQSLPVLDLRELWGVPGERSTFNIVILSSLSGDVAARVDSFGRIDESSVTPPGPLLSTLEYLSGTALSGSGDVIPILDPLGLSRLARRPDAWLHAATHGNQTRTRARVLLVDDSLSVRRLVGRMLERGGFEVETASDGQEALERLQLDGSFQAVISDLEMPRMNGYELLSALRGRSGSATLPVLIMTTRAGEKHQRLALQLGANDYFTKPVNEALLLRRVSSMVSMSSQPRPGQGLSA